MNGAWPVVAGIAALADKVAHGHYLGGEVSGSNGEVAAAGEAVERSLHNEAELPTLAPVDSGALAVLRLRRYVVVRGVLDSDVKRVTFDRRSAFRVRVREWTLNLFACDSDQLRRSPRRYFPLRS